MLDIELEEKLIKKVGGKFILTTLVQKRMVELHRAGARILVQTDLDKQDLLRIVFQEILQDKIQLAPREEVGYSLEEEKILIDKAKTPPSKEEEETVPSPEIYGSDIKKIKEQRIRELAELLNPDKK